MGVGERGVGDESKRQTKKIEISSFKNFRVLKKGIFSKSTKKIFCKILQIFKIFKIVLTNTFVNFNNLNKIVMLQKTTKKIISKIFDKYSIIIIPNNSFCHEISNFSRFVVLFRSPTLYTTLLVSEIFLFVKTTFIIYKFSQKQIIETYL